MKKVLVVSVGTAARNILDRCLEKAGDIDTLCIETHWTSFNKSNSMKKILIGVGIEIDIDGRKDTLGGRHTGGHPDWGEKAAKADLPQIKDSISGEDYIILVAGLGGGTGSGASPVIAESANSMGIHVVSIVTTPFSFEGEKRRRVSLECIEKLKETSDAVIIIDNNEILSERLGLLDAFKKTDDKCSDIILEKYKELKQEDRTNEIPLH